MTTDWQDAAVHARVAMRATQKAALETMRAARDVPSVESDWLLTLALGALREVTRFAAALRRYQAPALPTAIVQVDALGRALRGSVG